MLVELECVTIESIQVPKVTLFSKTTDVFRGTKPELANEDEMVIEPTIGSTVKFGAFVNMNKGYTTDFLGEQK